VHDSRVLTTGSDALVLDALRAVGRASVADLSARLDLGPATVRRALARLADEGRVLRTYGGAVLADPARPLSLPHEDPEIAAKQAIGAAAAGLVRDGETIALSSGTTVLEVARHLRGRRLMVITNALDAVSALLDSPGLDLVVLGGLVLPGVHSLQGHLTEQAMTDLRADRVFMGASAVDLEHGFMTEHVAEIPVDRALRRMAREAVVVVDATKLERLAPGFMFGFESVGTVVTDERIRRDIVDAITIRGPRVVVARRGRQEVPSG
jgi:DeoR family transcriptional regulator, aga operon transcriptional repressor